MICPACKTNNKDEGIEACVQCGSDLHVHQLLSEVRAGIQTTNKQLKSEKYFNLIMMIQIIPSILFLICTIFGIFVGMQFLAFIKKAELQNNFISTKPEIIFEQLQQMNSIIQKELDLIIEQRQEDHLLRAKIEKLTKNAAIYEHKIADLTSSPGGDEN